MTVNYRGQQLKVIKELNNAYIVDYNHTRRVMSKKTGELADAMSYRKGKMKNLWGAL